MRKMLLLIALAMLMSSPLLARNRASAENCPNNFHWDETGNECIHDRHGSTKGCPAGFRRNNSGVCQEGYKVGKKKSESSEDCPNRFYWDNKLGKCVHHLYGETEGCPEYYKRDELGKCKTLTVGCAKGWYWSDEATTCLRKSKH